ncbi:MAG: glycogen synthase GlgA [Gemmatimonadetes bacterium]|nr:MAG: glycogen synthase GlgA [Gemmatimonadota bacterium]
MHIIFAASEIVPFAKTGGLADVAGVLPKAVAAEGHQVDVFMPLYNMIHCYDHGIYPVEWLQDIPVSMGDRQVYFSVQVGKIPGANVNIYFIDAPYYFHRNAIYTNDPDEGERFILFSRAVLETIQRQGWQPDVIHCNDWQTGLIPAYLAHNYAWDRNCFGNTATLMTIHNIGYQGRFDKGLIYHAELPQHEGHPGGTLEFYGSFSMLKAGLVYADIINTVSERYAVEIQTAEYGHGLEGLLSARAQDVYGVVNGIDYTIWDPATDPLIHYHYTPQQLAGKYRNKKALLKRMGLTYDENIPVIGIVSRLVTQKGFDILVEAMFNLVQQDLQFVILGSGEYRYEEFFRVAAQTFPHKIGLWLGFNEELAHQIAAGTDMLLIPSRYEPCGLTQLYGLKYGTVPIVRRTGGLADTIKDFDGKTGTGFVFDAYTAPAMMRAIFRALKYYQDKDTWQTIMRNGMAQDFSWEVAAKKYIYLYEQAQRNRKTG